MRESPEQAAGCPALAKREHAHESVGMAPRNIAYPRIVTQHGQRRTTPVGPNVPIPPAALRNVTITRVAPTGWKCSGIRRPEVPVQGAAPRSRTHPPLRAAARFLGNSVSHSSYIFHIYTSIAGLIPNTTGAAGISYSFIFPGSPGRQLKNGAGSVRI